MVQEWEMLNGREVVKGWTAQLEAAQRFFADTRLPWEGDVTCHDCAAAPGQLHVPGCDTEVCPACKGQLIGCECDLPCKARPWPPEGH
jgi:hypothetical protein